MVNVSYGNGSDLRPRELLEFYQRLGHPLSASPRQVGAMIRRSAALASARVDGQLIGVARGLCDGVRGYFSECKLDPRFQGPGAVTRTDGRIEHDQHGIAAELARRVLARLRNLGVVRIDVLAWGTEVDFLEELGFRRSGGLVALTLRPEGGASGAAQPGRDRRAPDEDFVSIKRRAKG